MLFIWTIHYHLIGSKLFQFSRQFDFVNALGIVALDLGNQKGHSDGGEIGHEEDPDNQIPIIPKRG